MKKILVQKIKEIIENEGWNQTKVALLLNIDQPKISQIKHNKTQGFSLERLLSFLTKLHFGMDLAKTHHEIELSPNEIKLVINNNINLNNNSTEDSNIDGCH
ncbi:helix-turn-helix domain-containing protein [Candidatus Mesenet endosymbiont of Phosphuga atrata]|uniref:helix-turn-helix domain-containing protein n=1 Tax=Candidatus Mesenet endosymbiont of Phosphuga atrata TaxID=3066221 RepID=UPI0030CAE605